MSDDLLSLLSEDENRPFRKQAANGNADEKALASWAFLYTATDHGNATGIKFMAPISDAMRWCSSPKSRGMMHGAHWAYFFTSALNFVRYHRGDSTTYGEYPYVLDLNRLEDNGEWDERIAAEGVRMIKLDEIPRILEPLGVKCIGTPRVKRGRRSA